MRKIKSKADIERENKRNQIIIGVVMILLLVGAPLGYSLFSGDGKISQSSIEENGTKFINTNGYWKTQKDNQEFYFTNLPSNSSEINRTGRYNINDYRDKILYFVNGSQGVSEILINMNRYILRGQGACLDENCSDDLPVKNCSDNLIIFTEGDTDKVYKNENCVYIEGEEVKGADAFLYEVLDII